MSNIRKDLTWRQCYHAYMKGVEGLTGSHEFKAFLWWFFFRLLPCAAPMAALIIYASKL